MTDAPIRELRTTPDMCGRNECCAPAAAITKLRKFRGGLTFKARGLTCAEEVAVLKRAVGPLVGGPDLVAFDVLNGRLTVSSDVRVPAEDIVRAVAGTGVVAAIWEPQKDRDEADSHHRWQVRLTAARGIGVMLGRHTARDPRGRGDVMCEANRTTPQRARQKIIEAAAAVRI